MSLRRSPNPLHLPNLPRQSPAEPNAMRRQLEETGPPSAPTGPARCFLLRELSPRATAGLLQAFNVLLGASLVALLLAAV